MGRRRTWKERSPGSSYRHRVEQVNRIYQEHSHRGLSNREIWFRYIYPVYGICERTFYNLLKASSEQGDALQVSVTPSLFDSICDEQGRS